MNFFKKLFGRRPRDGSGASPGGGAGAGPPGEPPADGANPYAHLFGPPEGDSPIVTVGIGDALMIMHRETYEYQHGLASGADPSQADLDAAIGRADRVRVLGGGLYRGEPIGTEVVLDTGRKADLEALRQALRVVEDPSTFGRCACLGGPTLEFYAGKERVAAIAIHHGHGIRWSRWKHDARLAEPHRLAAWLRAHGLSVDPDEPTPHPEPAGEDPSRDFMSLGLLALPEAVRHALRAESHRRRGELRQANEECARALKLDPVLPLGFGIRGLIHREAGRHVDAEADCNEAIRLGLEDPEVYLARAVARDIQGRPMEALADCDHALKLDPRRAAAFNSRAVIRARLGRIVEALADYGKAMELAPDWPMPAGNRGSAHLGIGRFREAVSDLTEAIRRFEAAAEHAPQSLNTFGTADVSVAAYHAVRGEAFAALGEDEDALADYNRAAELGPDDPRVFLSRGRFLFRQGETDAALADFDEAIRLRPDLREGYLERAQARAALQDFDEALSDVTEAVRWSPDDPAPFFLRGQILGQVGRFADALRDFDQVVRLAPENPQGFFLRAGCRSRNGDDAGQHADLEEAVRIAPDWPIALNSLAWHLATSPVDEYRDGPRAVELARHAVEIVRQPDPEILDTLAAAFAETGDFRQARAVVEEAIHLMGDPVRRNAYEERLALYEAERPYREARPPDRHEGPEAGIA